MKKLLSILAAVMLLLCACAQGGGDGEAVTKSKKDSFTPSGQKVESSVFGRNVKYNSFSPAENISLPIESTEILDAVQIEKRLYIIGSGAVHSLDIETGESARLFDTNAAFIDALASELILFDTEASEFCIYDTSGALLSKTAVSELSGDAVTDFAACEDYYVLLCGEDIISVNRSDGTIASKTKAKKTTRKLCARSGNKAFVYVENVDVRYLYEYDAKSGSLTKLRDLPQVLNIFDITYNPKSGTVIILGENDKGVTELYEYALDSEDNAILKKFDMKIDLHAKRAVSVFENIISVISNDEDVYRWFDYENPPESITLAYIGEASARNIDIEDIILNYEMSHYVIVRTICYNDDRTRLSLKLMAGDTDIDIFSTLSMDEYLFMNSHMYTDLKSFPSLSGKISSNVFTDFASSRNGEYVGLPYGVTFDLNGHENVSGFTAIEQYCIKNVDALNGQYTDESGDELYKIMKFAAENPEPEKAYYDFPYSIIRADYLIINPSSERKDLAADFLEYALDVYSGAQSVVQTSDDMMEHLEATGSLEWLSSFDGFWEKYYDPINYHYPDMESTENVYLEMDFRPWSIVEPLFDAYNAARYGKVTDKSEMKKLAKEAAAQTRMRLME